jgi:hypothetical protein
VVANALGTANVISVLVRLWQDAEKQRTRRSCLRPSGDVQPLSADWLAALRNAVAQLFIRPEAHG